MKTTRKMLARQCTTLQAQIKANVEATASRERLRQMIRDLRKESERLQKAVELSENRLAEAASTAFSLRHTISELRAEIAEQPAS